METWRQINLKTLIEQAIEKVNDELSFFGKKSIGWLARRKLVRELHVLLSEQLAQTWDIIIEAFEADRKDLEQEIFMLRRETTGELLEENEHLYNIIAILSFGMDNKEFAFTEAELRAHEDDVLQIKTHTRDGIGTTIVRNLGKEQT